MKNFGISAAIMTAMLFMSAPVESLAQALSDPYIDMSTTVKREVTPNEIYLRITISESDYKGRKTLEQMQEAMIGALKINRIDIPECLTISYMGSDISYKLFSKSIKPKSEATYMLKLNDVATMQRVISSLEEREISNIELARLKFTKENELKTEMAIEAMQQAQAEAKVLAGAIGQEIGKAMSINSWMNGGETQPRLYKSRANMAMMDGAASPADNAPEFGISKITYTFNVNVRFELK
jgi:uncharacterized protein YggE